MKAKTTTVTLAVGDVTQEFEISHAERLLRMTKAGWHIPENSKFEFVENGIRYKQNPERGSRGKKRAESVGGKDAPTED
jgi:hypothetical protein